MTKDEFKALVQELKPELPTCYLDEFPSSFHHEVRITHKENKAHNILVSWHPSGVIVSYRIPGAPKGQQLAILALHIPSITVNYIVATVKKYLYASEN